MAQDRALRFASLAATAFTARCLRWAAVMFSAAFLPPSEPPFLPPFAPCSLKNARTAAGSFGLVDLRFMS
jgi:hypothetical protein